MADNTLQYEWVSTIKWNLEHLYADREDVFVAGDNLVYPEEYDASVCQAPDVYVAFGRPKGYRGSYKVFEEGGVFPQVVFEVWSPGNTVAELEEKRAFYERYGAEEFYLLFPEFPAFIQGWWRASGKLVRVVETNGFVSPRLQVHFHFSPQAITLTGPDGRPFLNPARIAAERDRERHRAEAEKLRADEAVAKAERLAARLRELGVDPNG
jgi:Uma2 family endonuclease